MTKAGIFILTQNTPERKIYLKTCLYFLFKNFNQYYRYPVIILHEDYDIKSQEEIVRSVRAECIHLVSFLKIDKEDFEIPDFIDKEKLNKAIETFPTPYWRNIRYRLMCRFWLINFYKYCKNYDYYMRIDDDGFIEEKINNDLFKLMEDKDIKYISNIIHIDCGICCYKMRDFFEINVPDKKDELKNIFTDAKLPLDNQHFLKFKNTYKIVEGKDFDDEEFKVSMPLMYYNNFMLTDISFWNRPEILDLVNKIDKEGNIFYYRYGDAPIQTILIMLFEPNKISRTVFKYSKRLQRESFIDDNNNIHAYFPNTYRHTSCITYKD